MSKRGPVDEAYEPYEPRRRVPLPVYWVAIALALWGALTLWQDSTADRTGARERLMEANALERRQTMTGSALFAERCATCHQADGSGISGAIPPLASSRFVQADPRVIVQILLHGITGPIVVDGDDFNGHMPAFGSVLDDDQLARLATAVRRTWGPGGTIDPRFVAAERARTANRGIPWSGGAEIAAALDPAIGIQPAYHPLASASADTTALSIARNGKSGGWPCASCHGANGEGRDGVPRLAGQSADYIAGQLLAFANGSRPNDIMRPVASQLSASERGGLGRLYAGLASPSTSRSELAIWRGGPNWHSTATTVAICHPVSPATDLRDSGSRLQRHRLRRSNRVTQQDVSPRSRGSQGHGRVRSCPPSLPVSTIRTGAPWRIISRHCHRRRSLPGRMPDERQKRGSGDP